MIQKAETTYSDTSKEAAQKQIEILQQMGSVGRAELTFRLCDELRNTTKSGIRHRHPHYTEQQVTQAYLRLILDKPLFEQVFPGCEIQP